jgi:hypothetical protein
MNKVTHAVLKCAARCAKRRDLKGEDGINCSACDMDTDTDPAMKACVNKARDKANAKIEKKCLEKAGGFPQCSVVYNGAESGADVTDFAFVQLCAQDPPRHAANFCASPNGAFIDLASGVLD